MHICLGGAKDSPCRDLALGGIVEPAHLPERAWAPDRDTRVTKPGPWPNAWPSGVCAGLWCMDCVLFGALAAEISAASLG